LRVTEHMVGPVPSGEPPLLLAAVSASSQIAFFRQAMTLRVLSPDAVRRSGV